MHGRHHAAPDRPSAVVRSSPCRAAIVERDLRARSATAQRRLLEREDAGRASGDGRDDLAPERLEPLEEVGVREVDDHVLDAFVGLGSERGDTSAGD